MHFFWLWGGGVKIGGNFEKNNILSIFIKLAPEESNELCLSICTRHYEENVFLLELR